MTAAAAELVLDARAELGEGPRWDARGQRLLWVDIMSGRVHAFQPATASCRSVDVGRPVGALTLAADGGVVLAVAGGFARLDWESGRTRMLATVAPDFTSARITAGVVSDTRSTSTPVASR